MLTEDLKGQYLELRRAILKKEYAYLNDKQREAVFAANGPLLILAGAGSGKTTVLINRIAYLIRFGNAYESDAVPPFVTEEDVAALTAYYKNGAGLSEARLTALLADRPVRPYSILAITFTNKAAGELKERLRRTLGPDDSDGVWAATFHSACVRILRRECERIGYKRSFTIYDSDDSKRVIKETLEALKFNEKDFPPRLVADAISKAKDMLLTPEQFAKASQDDHRQSQIAKIYAGYQRRLFEANAFDFDDLIMQTVRLLEECPDALEYYQNKFQYILVDEYQDTNHAQYKLTSLLAGKWRNICVVGDDDQSIYGFRGANIANILGFEREYDDARVIRLEQNYRSTAMILAAANAVIANNRERKGKKLWTRNEDGELLTLYRADNEQEEARFVADTILRNQMKGRPFRDHAILYRMNALSNTMENVLIRNGIPYRIVGGTRFFDRMEVKDMLAYLQVIANPEDTLRLTRIINTPSRKIGNKSIDAAKAEAQMRGVSLFTVLENADQFDSIPKAAQTSMVQFARMIRRLQKLSEELSLDELYEEVMEQSGYRLSLMLKPSEENNNRLENISELKTSLVQYAKDAQEPTLSGFLEEVSLFTDLDQYDAGADAVTLMTIHSAKGLEFPCVFMIGMEEGIFPSHRSMETRSDLEEERRLAYVGITRARELLYLTHARHHMLYGKTSINPPSRFIDELPEECTVRLGRPQNERPSFSGIPGGAAFNDFDFDQRPKMAERTVAPSRTTAKPARESVRPAAAAALAARGQSKGSDSLPAYAPGIRVHHTAFGEGMIISCREMGNDKLLEIAFDEKGTKKLFTRTAKQYLTIL